VPAGSDQQPPRAPCRRRLPERHKILARGSCAAIRSSKRPTAAARSRARP
jgi:hypothetical protein